jgi:hypothetical protein
LFIHLPERPGTLAGILGGKNVGTPSASPFAHQTITDAQRQSERLRAPLGMGMNGEQNLSTHALGLGRGVRTKEPLEVDDVGWGQLKRWLMTQ